MFNVLIVGLGQIGMGYDLDLNHSEYIYTHSSAFNRHKGFNIVGGVDIDKKLGRIFEKKYDCISYSDTKVALKQSNPDIVIIAVPTDLHNQVLKDIVKYSKPKIVLCEKPLSYSVKEAHSMKKLCNSRSIKLFVNYMRNSLPNSIEIKNKIKNNEYFGSFKGVAWYSKGLIHNGFHFVSLLTNWLGPIKEGHCIYKGRLLDNQDVEPDFSLSFERGNVIFLATEEENFSNYAIELNFENGRLRYERGGREVYWTPVQKDNNLLSYKFLSNESVKFTDNSMEQYQLHVANELWNALNQQNYELCSDAISISIHDSINKIIKGCI